MVGCLATRCHYERAPPRSNVKRIARADYCWAMSDWYRDRGDLTRAQDWADAARLAPVFADIAEWSAQRLAELAAEREDCAANQRTHDARRSLP